MSTTEVKSLLYKEMIRLLFQVLKLYNRQRIHGCNLLIFAAFPDEPLKVNDFNLRNTLND